MNEKVYVKSAAMQMLRLDALDLIDAGDIEKLDSAIAEAVSSNCTTDNRVGWLYNLARKSEVSSYYFAEAPTRLERRYLPDWMRLILERIAQDCVDNSNICILTRAQLEKGRIFEAFDSGNTAEAEDIISQLETGLYDDPNQLAVLLRVLGELYYSEARWMQLDPNEANNALPYFERAVASWQRAYIECPNSPLAPVACFGAAWLMARQLSRWSCL